jgi:hypothetical protein
VNNLLIFLIDSCFFFFEFFKYVLCISNFVVLSPILAPIYLKLVSTFRCGTMFTLLVPELCFFGQIGLFCFETGGSYSILHNACYYFVISSCFKHVFTLGPEPL